jgi:hypothetical protein
LALHSDSDRPDEAQELAAHRRDYLLLTFAASQQLAITRVQPELRLPANGLDLLTERGLAFPQRAVDGRPMPIGPRRFDGDAPQVSISGLGDPAPPGPRAA